MKLAARVAGGLGVVAVLVWAAAGAGADDPPVDPGVRACGYIAAGVLPDDPAAVGRMAAASGVPALAASGARLRDARTAVEVGAASAQLARVCRAWRAP